MMKSIRRESRHAGVGRHQAQWLKVSAWLAAGALLWAASLAARVSAPGEYAVKAAYLYNFGRFVEWPPQATTEGSFSICVLGMDPFGRVLDGIVAGHTIDGKKVVARRIARSEGAAGCRVIFISSSEAGELTRVLAALANSAVLTVSDMPQFTQSGGMIGFVQQDNRIRFAVNLAAAQRVGLKLSAQLLKLAVNVIKGGSSGG
ncbi:MAG: YfiR family protein [Terriglobia bacterium]